jgi:hypothetical protein
MSDMINHLKHATSVGVKVVFTHSRQKFTGTSSSMNKYNLIVTN